MDFEKQLAIEEEYLNQQKEHLTIETKRIKFNWDWHNFDFFLQNIKTTIGKIQLLKKLIEEEEGKTNQ